MDAFQALLVQITDCISRTDDNRRSSMAVEFAILTLLIDKGLTTIPEFSERLALTQKVLGNNYQGEEIKTRLDLLIGFLTDSADQGKKQAEPQKPSWNPVVHTNPKERD